MEFKGEKKKAKTEDKPKDDAAKEDDKPAADSEAGPADSEKPKDEAPADQPQTIKEKPGGCSFRALTRGQHDSQVGLAITALALSSVMLRRRKRAA
jgi:hypothetical protein